MTIEVIDLRTALHDGPIPMDIVKEISSGLSLPAGQRELPTLVLYDEKGLRLYDHITTDAPEYYLFGAEEGILKTRADEIVQTMHQGKGVVPGEVVVELGAGFVLMKPENDTFLMNLTSRALRKTSLILSGLARLVGDGKSIPPVTYYALDLEQRELERSLDEITKSDIGHELATKVATKGMWGTYDDGLRFLCNDGLESHKLSTNLEFRSSNSSPVSCPDSPLTPVEGNQAPLHIMFLGSTLGNFPRSDTASFLRSLPLRPYHGDTLLLGLDQNNDKGLIELAYNDPQNYTKRFIFNGLRVAGRALGDENMFDETKWDYANCYDAVSLESLMQIQVK